MNILLTNNTDERILIKEVLLFWVVKGGGSSCSGINLILLFINSLKQ